MFERPYPSPSSTDEEELKYNNCPIQDLYKMALSGMTDEMIQKETNCSPYRAQVATCMPRKHSLPTLMPMDILRAKEMRSWDAKHRRIVELSMKKRLNQKEIAAIEGCAQSTVAYTLARFRKLQKAVQQQLVNDRPSYRTRLHLYLHDMSKWELIKKLDFGSEKALKAIDECILYNSPEMILLDVPYSEHQLDKLVMDIVLATGGECVIIADTYDSHATGNTHAVYFICDCIHTLDLDGEKGERGWDVPMKAQIQYAEDWIAYLGVDLSPNDEKKLENIIFWRF